MRCYGAPLLGLLGITACAVVTGEKTEKDHGTVIGNPGDVDMSVGAGPGAVARSATASGAVLTQTDCDGTTAETSLGESIDLIGATVALAFDSICQLTLDFDGPLILAGEATGGGTFTASLDLDSITVISDDGFETDEQDFVFELGEPDWLDAEQMGLVADADVEIDSVHPVHPLLVASLTERSQVFADDGDGAVSDEERATGAAAASESIAIATRFIAVGDSFRRITSADGGDLWTFDQQVADEEPLWAAGYGEAALGGLYIAAGGNSRGVVMTSLDGASWTEATVVDASLCGVAHSEGGGFVVVGYEGHRLQSDDGVIWVDNRDSSEATYKSVVHGGGFYVAVGFGGVRSRSEDGQAWTDIDLAGLATRDLLEVSYGDGTFVAVGGGGLVSVSGDGEIWTDDLEQAAADLTGVAYGGGRFVAIGEGVSLVSEDGESWTEHPLAPALHKIAYGDGAFVAVGEDGAYRSGDGVVWSELTLSGSPQLQAIGFGPSL